MIGCLNTRKLQVLHTNAKNSLTDTPLYVQFRSYYHANLDIKTSSVHKVTDNINKGPYFATVYKANVTMAYLSG